MTKVMQTHYLVVYQDLEDLKEFVDKHKASVISYKYDAKMRALTVVDEYLGQCNYHSVRYDGEIEPFIMQICSYQFAGVCFLEGDYPSRLVNWCLSRVRGGVWEVDAI